MSESPENFPLDPAALQRLEEMLQHEDNMPDFLGTAIKMAARGHAQWYRAWQDAGVPEQRAAEWMEAMIRALVTGPGQ